MVRKVVSYWGAPPPSVPPSTYVRRLDTAFGIGAFVFFAILLSSSWLLSLPLLASLANVAWFATLTIYSHPLGLAWRQDASWLDWTAFSASVGIATLLAWWVIKAGLRPYNGIRHVDGPELLDGKEALVEAKLQSAEVCAGQKPWIKLHPALGVSREHFARHTLVIGGVGSGKTQIIKYLVRQMAKRRRRMFIYDIKADFIRMLPPDRTALFNPWDDRSLAWDIARDIDDKTKADFFAAAMVPIKGGSNPFFELAARQLISGSLQSLQRERGRDWDVRDLSLVTALPARELLRVMQEHAPKAANFISDPTSSTTSSVMATLSAYTSMLDSLAAAWNPDRERFALSDWVSDGYKGRRKFIVVMAGVDKELTRSYISAMVNTLAALIDNPAFPDNRRRTLAFFLDECPSLGRIALDTLVDRGRSKGTQVLLAMQDSHQLEEVWGRPLSKSMMSMIATRIVCQMHPSQSRSELSESFEKKRVAILNTSRSDPLKGTGSRGENVHEEARAVVTGHDIGDLGTIRNKKLPGGFATRAIIKVGKNPLVLDWPAALYPDVCEGHVPAVWDDWRPVHPSPLVENEVEENQGLIGAEAAEELLSRLQR